MAMAAVKVQTDLVKTYINGSLADTEPWKVVAGTIGATLTFAFVYSQLTHKTPLLKRIKKSFFRLVRKLPPVQKQIAQETAKVQASFEEEFQTPCKDMEDVVVLPQKGMDREELIDITKKYLSLGSADWTKGSESGTVYNGNHDLTTLMTEVYGLAAWTNPLHPDTFPGVRKMEAEIVRMCCNLFHGGGDSCGTVTSGGTESIILACKAYRDYAREVRGIQHPVIVVPVTAHAAFDKAAQILDIELVHVPVDPVTQRVSVTAMRRAITSSTCMLVGSAPQFPHGSIDDIRGIAQLGIKYGIPVHVDACLGGFVIAFMADAGFPLPPFDFSVSGVTSISADTHKYGFAPKGSSVILYSEPKYRHYQWFSFPDWTGGIYATCNIGGSRAGGIIAACWAALVYHGRDGYVESTKVMVKTTRYIAQALRKVEGIKIVGEPEVTVIGIASDHFNIYSLSDGMKKRGWSLNVLQFPSAIHLCVTMLHTQEGVADKFIADITECTAVIMKDPSSHQGGSAAVYGMAQSLPDRSIVDQIAWTYLDAYYTTQKSGAEETQMNGKSH